MASATALRTLRTQCLEVAERFSDYNFRTYFVKHTADTFDAVAAKPDAEVTKFLETEGKVTLDQLVRMTAVDNMHCRVPVILDSRKPGGY